MNDMQEIEEQLLELEQEIYQSQKLVKEEDPFDAVTSLFPDIHKEVQLATFEDLVKGEIDVLKKLSHVNQTVKFCRSNSFRKTFLVFGELGGGKSTSLNYIMERFANTRDDLKE